ncbi:hypothetical protein BpHYR1_052419 [Brachionus plicatilis]|uniref:Uncharacterized protein n=1 Tax=Brachionus plicatilis TaxID=10195 RepID=A0A3M7QXF3_BRAPC|nr:hypothetical protein BpHYR1_052419 [Brachionus plicatilis]
MKNFDWIMLVSVQADSKRAKNFKNRDRDHLFKIKQIMFNKIKFKLFFSCSIGLVVKLSWSLKISASVCSLCFLQSHKTLAFLNSQFSSPKELPFFRIVINLTKKGQKILSNSGRITTQSEKCHDSSCSHIGLIQGINFELSTLSSLISGFSESIFSAPIETLLKFLMNLSLEILSSSIKSMQKSLGYERAVETRLEN